MLSGLSILEFHNVSIAIGPVTLSIYSLSLLLLLAVSLSLSQILGISLTDSISFAFSGFLLVDLLVEGQNCLVAHQQRHREQDKAF